MSDNLELRDSFSLMLCPPQDNLRVGTVLDEQKSFMVREAGAGVCVCVYTYGQPNGHPLTDSGGDTVIITQLLRANVVCDKTPLRPQPFA